MRGAATLAVYVAPVAACSLHWGLDGGDRVQVRGQSDVLPLGPFSGNSAHLCSELSVRLPSVALNSVSTEVPVLSRVLT